MRQNIRKAICDEKQYKDGIARYGGDRVKKKILLVISTLSGGGAERVFANISKYISDECEVDFLLNDLSDISYEYAGNIIDLGAKPQKDKTKITYHIKVSLKKLVMLRKLKKTGQYSICLSAMTSSNVLNILSGNKNCKVYLTEHNYVSADAGKGLKRWIIVTATKRLYNSADRIIVVSHGVKKDLQEKFGILKEKIRVIYNGFSINEILEKKEDYLPCEIKKTAGQFSIVTIGRLEYQKGQWNLIRALAKVKQYFDDVHLYILGEGKLREQLEKLAKEMNVAKNITFTSFVKNPYAYLGKSDLFVQPSLYEGFGNVIVEAMSCGIPCIASDYNVGAREILAPDTDVFYRTKTKIEYAKYGVLCPVCNESAIMETGDLSLEEDMLADAIIELLKNEKLRAHYAELGPQRAWEFDMKNIKEEWIKVFEE